MLQFLVLFHLRLFILALFVDRAEAVELLHGAGGAQGVIARRDVNRGLVEDRGGHLRSDEALPDQLVEFEFIGAQNLAQRIGRAQDVRGPDRFVRVLGAFLAAVMDGFGGQIIVSESFLDVTAHRGESAFRHAGGIRTHVSDEADGAFLRQLDALIEVLRHHHGFLGVEAQLAHGFLLQLAGDEGRHREFPLLFGGDRLHDQAGRP